MTQAVRQHGRFTVLEDTDLTSLKNRMRQALKMGYKINNRHGYSIDENITHYENVKDGERWQGILEKAK